MYRNISYYIDKQDQWHGVIRLDTWDENGKRVTKEFTHKSHLYIRDKRKDKDNAENPIRSIYDKPLRKLTFDSVIGRNKWMRDNSSVPVYECLPPVREFLLDNFEGQQESIDFLKHDLRIHIVDIECAVEDDFPDVKCPQYAINAMTIFDSLLDTYHCWVLNDKPEDFPDYDNIVHHTFASEVEMLGDMMDWYKRNRPDVITGWNVDKFDIPYIYQRLKQLLGEKCANSLSPTYTVHIRKDVMQRGDFKPYDQYRIDGVSVIDYLFLFKNKFPNIKLSNNKLETVGQEVLGYGKLDHTELKFKDFWKQDFKRYVKYNIQDVKLIWDLEKELKYLYLTRRICNMGLCEYESIYKSQPYILGAIILQARANGKLIRTHSGEEQDKIGKFAGAHVFKPTFGFYGRGVSSLDLNSLYPNIMITLNISPETKIGKVVEETEDFVVIKLESGKIVKYDQAKFQRLLETKLTISENKILYWKATFKKGIIPQFLERLYTERRATKDHMLKVDAEMQVLKKQGLDYSELSSKRDLLDATQSSFKLFLNSVYGQMGSQYFPMFDLENAEAVTLSGQHIIKSASEYINKWFLENYDQEGALVYGDTDSNYFHLTDFVNKEIGIDGEFTEENIEHLINVLDTKFVPAVNKHCINISKKHFHSPLERIEFKRETFCTEGIFLSKKRYVLHVRNDEGVYKDKFKYVGVDVVKSELPKKVKAYLKFVIESSMCERWDSQKYKDNMKRIWLEYQELGFDDVAKFMGYNTERKADGFLQPAKGATGQSKASIYHNQLLRDLKIRHKYNDIMVGEKIRSAYIQRNNSYRIKIIGWSPGQLPSEFEDEFNIDHKVMFEKTILKPLERFITVHQWPKFDPTDDELCDISKL
jgi:DNA polymerase elongation subunit (family B)